MEKESFEESSLTGIMLIPQEIQLCVLRRTCWLKTKAVKNRSWEGDTTVRLEMNTIMHSKTKWQAWRRGCFSSRAHTPTIKRRASSEQCQPLFKLATIIIMWDHHKDSLARNNQSVSRTSDLCRSDNAIYSLFSSRRRLHAALCFISVAFKLTCSLSTISKGLMPAGTR